MRKYLSIGMALLLLITLFAGCNHQSVKKIETTLTKRTPIIIDCDTGIADFYALAYIKTCDQLDLRGVTVSYGATTLEYAAINALSATSLYGLNCPVSMGSQHALNGTASPRIEQEGENGLGNVVLPCPDTDFDERKAWDLIYDLAKEEQGQLRIITMGPLTNLAIALKEHPDIKDLLAGITILAGNYATETNDLNTNNTSFDSEGTRQILISEPNAYSDAAAFEQVLGSGVPLTLIGEEITDLSLLGYQENSLLPKGQGQNALDDWLSPSGPYSKYFRAVRAYANTRADGDGTQDYLYLPEVVAILSIINHDLLTYQPIQNIIFDGAILSFETTSNSNVQIAASSDRALLFDLLYFMPEFYSK